MEPSTARCLRTHSRSRPRRERSSGGQRTWRRSRARASTSRRRCTTAGVFLSTSGQLHGGLGYALDAKTGKVLWKFQETKNPDRRRPPAVGGGQCGRRAAAVARKSDGRERQRGEEGEGCAADHLPQ